MTTVVERNATEMARDLRLFYLFRLLATSYLWQPIFVLYMASRGLGFDEVMILSAIYSGVVILVEVPTGAFADRIGRRHSMVAGALAMVASCLVAYSAHSFSVFAVAEVLAAVSMALCSGADSAYLYDLLHANGRGDEYAKREGVASAFHLGGMAVACVGGGLLGSINLAIPYLVTAGVSALACVAALLMRDEHTFSSRAPAASVRGSATEHAKATVAGEFKDYVVHMGEALRDVLHSKQLIWIMSYSVVAFILLKATSYLYQPYLNGRGFSIVGMGIVFGGFYVLAAVVAFKGNWLRTRFGEEVLVWGLLGTLAISFALLRSIPGEWALGLLAVQAAATGLYSPLVKPLLNRPIRDSRRRATILSVDSIARRFGMGFFSPVVGYYGADEALNVCGILGGVGLVALVVMAKFSPTRTTFPVSTSAGGAPVASSPSSPTVD